MHIESAANHLCGMRDTPLCIPPNHNCVDCGHKMHGVLCGINLDEKLEEIKVAIEQLSERVCGAGHNALVCDLCMNRTRNPDNNLVAAADTHLQPETSQGAVPHQQEPQETDSVSAAGGQLQTVAWEENMGKKEQKLLAPWKYIAATPKKRKKHVKERMEISAYEKLVILVGCNAPGAQDVHAIAINHGTSRASIVRWNKACKKPEKQVEEGKGKLKYNYVDHLYRMKSKVRSF